MLLSLSVQGLQGMVDMCAQHASETDLLFSTDPVNPEKSKTMCIAFGSKDKNNLSNVRPDMRYYADAAESVCVKNIKLCVKFMLEFSGLTRNVSILRENRYLIHPCW